MTINIALQHEFKLACDLLYIKPEEIIEAFMSNVSLPYFCSTNEYLSKKVDTPNQPLQRYELTNHKGKTSPANPVKMLATNFLLTYCTIYNERFLPAKKVHEKYLKNYKALMPELKAESNPESRRFQLMCFYLDWHRDLINNISENDVIIDVKATKANLIPTK